MNKSTERIDRIRRALEQALEPKCLDIVDESHLHAGHAGAATGRGHFRIAIVADAFAGLVPLARHRKVYEALAELMQTDIHALSIKAATPAESRSADAAGGS